MIVILSYDDHHDPLVSFATYDTWHWIHILFISFPTNYKMLVCSSFDWVTSAGDDEIMSGPKCHYNLKCPSTISPVELGALNTCSGGKPPSIGSGMALIPNFYFPAQRRKCRILKYLQLRDKNLKIWVFWFTFRPNVFVSWVLYPSVVNNCFQMGSISLMTFTDWCFLWLWWFCRIVSSSFLCTLQLRWFRALSQDYLSSCYFCWQSSSIP